MTQKSWEVFVVRIFETQSILQIQIRPALYFFDFCVRDDKVGKIFVLESFSSSFILYFFFDVWKILFKATASNPQKCNIGFLTFLTLFRRCTVQFWFIALQALHNWKMKVWVNRYSEFIEWLERWKVFLINSKGFMNERTRFQTYLEGSNIYI